MPDSPSSSDSRRSDVAIIALLLAALSAAAAWYVAAQGWTLWYGDAQAHLMIARRIFDAREPGYEQIGTVWLPLPHLLMLPFVQKDAWYWSGVGGAIPVAACFVTGGVFLFLGMRRLFGRAAAWASSAVYALNPNMLYLQSSPMTEPVLFCWFAGLFYFLARWHESKKPADAALAGAMALCATLTRYEGWFLLPFVALLLLLCGGERRWGSAMAFCGVAALGPLYWLAHNQVFYSNVLEFYNGPWSAKMIYQRQLDSGLPRYPGDHDWGKAWLYYREAARLCAGTPLLWLCVAGAIAALWKRAWWALALFALLPLFYVLSMYSSGTPIYVPHLWPNSHYNTRYGLNALMLGALCAGALVAVAPQRWRAASAVAVAALAVWPWALRPSPEAWVTWSESRANSESRRAWTRAASEYLEPRYKRGAGVFMPFGDLSGILREAHIPLRESFHETDRVPWIATARKPEILLREEWAIAFRGDDASRAMQRVSEGAPRYQCVRMFATKGAPVVEIWRRIQ